MSSNALKAAATGQMPQSKNPVAAFSGFLDKFKSQISLALPKHLNADRMCRLALTCFSRDPKLQQCDPQSIVAGIVTASQLGLEIGVNGQAYLLPYGRQAQMVPGWKGLTDLANRSGRSTVWTGAVFEGDEFDYQLGDAPFIRHRPGDEDDPAKLTHVYAVGRVNGSNWPVLEVWTMRKIWKHRDQNNKVGRAHYSFKHPEMYARKIPLLQVLKYMPSSVELTNAVTLTQAAENGQRAVIDGDFVTVTEVPEDDATTSVPAHASVASRAQQHAALPEPTQPPVVVQQPVMQAQAQPMAAQSAGDDWEPSAEELAEIHRREMEEAGQGQLLQAAPAPAPTPAPARRGRGAGSNSFGSLE